ncbi:hypothetical protein [Bradyrhizobium japonicum]|uniref:hypothetical protein n=1 Tax=Bradyrhizobium japonicum TaxID=375 RepID=UPI001E3C585D|nr:hypothetical protein [Bradyrhizobium japonicum]MCD9817640.1 hypothetical protein [Bradyrhizobium japonicum]MEB2672517.1 hypothetical protein [Bradyrhizobium japonicum]WRI91778.1 hypothetical protein R3F75_12960 [Bradyrhizobium japonicum]
MNRSTIALTFIALFPAFAVMAETTLPDRGAAVGAQSDRTNDVSNAATAVQKGANDLQDKALVSSAKAEVQKLWPQIAGVYAYIGNRGLLLEVNVVVNDTSAKTPSPQKQVQDVTIIGVGSDPAHAWAENLQDRLHPANSGYSRSLADSWFIWITPGRRGWPQSAPDYTEADSKELLDRREPRNSVLVDGTRIRGMLFANDGLRLETRMRAIAATAEAAEATANNAQLRAAAATLRKNAEDASKALAEINTRLKSNLEAAARAQDALRVLDGTLAVGSAITKMADAFNMLGPNAPSGPSANMTQDQAVTYINKLAEQSKISSVEYEQQRTVTIRHIDGQVDIFRHDFKGSQPALPPPY